VKRFRNPQLKQIAEHVEAEFADAFRPYRAQLRVVPIRISHIVAVGEGVQLDLDPDDRAKWDWWGDFEADMEVSRRSRFSHRWNELVATSDVELWLRGQAREYLAQLNRGSPADTRN
jgi:hypothetical protein